MFGMWNQKFNVDYPYKRERQVGKERLDSLSRYEFDGSINKLMEKLREHKETYPQFQDLVIDTHLYGGNDPELDITLYGLRMENDEEYAARTAKLDENDAATKKKELEDLERLKNKYESKR